MEPGDLAERWPEVERRLEELLELSAEERAPAVEAIEDPWLAAQLRRLLAHVDGDSDLLDAPIGSAFPELVSALAGDGGDGVVRRQVGAYRLVRVLGRGGMGVVHLAERADESFEKRVAIKLLPRGLESDETRRRFLLERQVLAQLEHPNVARLLDGGVTDEGTPYLVMELVEGQPIDLWCAANGLSLRDRISLFLEVCEAVQYAHRKLVIHRDLKPSNILVSGDGVKLLDFGVAKLIEDEPGGGTPLTRLQPRTAAYASPEQLANRPVSTASDVYSLGVVLFELLTGRTPHDLGALSPAEAERLLLDSSPRRASEVAAAAGGFAAGWHRRLRGDLDRILSRALARDAERRYPSVEALAQDLRRHLAGHPVEAREPTLHYRAGRFIRRHRVGSAVTALFVLAVGAALLGISWQARRAADEARRATRVASLMIELFEDADPFSGSENRDMSVVELLERGEARLRAQLVGESRLYADLLEAIALAYQGQARYEAAARLHREVLDARRGVLPEDHPEIVLSELRLGTALEGQGLYEEAEPILAAAAERIASVFGEESPEYADVLIARGNLANQQGRYVESIARFERALAIRRELAGEPDLEVAAVLHLLSGSLDLAGQDEEGLRMLYEALDIAGRELGDEHPTISVMRTDLGVRLFQRGDVEGAIDSSKQVLAALEGRFGVGAPATADVLTNLGRYHLDLGDVAGAAPYVERAAAIHSALAPTHFNRIAAEVNLGSLRREQGRLDESEELYRWALERFEELVGPSHQATARVRTLLAGTLHLAGRFDEAERQYQRSLEDSRSPTADPYRFSETLIGFGSLLADLERFEQAEPLLREGLERRRAVLAQTRWQVAEAEMELGALLVRKGEVAEGGDLLWSSLPVIGSVLPDDNFRRRRAERHASLAGIRFR